jgi:hypothetical protein
VRRDNGGEFTAAKRQVWLARCGPTTVYIGRPYPWEYGYSVSFIRNLQDECLNLSRAGAVGTRL